MKKILLVVLGCAILAQAQALTGADSDKQLLFQILKERQDHFSAYTKSLDEATGIFGFKTKKDIQRSNAILIDIVKLDNRMIAVLNRELNYKDFEKTSMNYNNLDDQKDLDLLRQNLAVSDTRIKELSAKLLDDQQQINNRNRAIVLLSLGLLFLLYRRRQAKKAV